MDKIVLTQREYNLLLELYHECNEAFKTLGQEYKEAFYDRLYGRTWS